MQTSYSQDPVAGLPGMISRGVPTLIISRIAEGAVTPGLLVVSSDTEDECKHPTATWASAPATVLGIVHLDPARVLPAYADKDILGVVKQGFIWVTFEPDTTPAVDSQVFGRITANGAGKLIVGSLRANADTATAVLLDRCYFRRIVGALAEVELNI